MRTCPECSNTVDDKAIFCDNCGLRLSPASDQVAFQTGDLVPNADQNASRPSQPSAGIVQPGTCSACGYANIPGEMFCQNCGVQLAPVASIPPPGPTPIAASPPAVELAGAARPETCPSCGRVNLPGEMFCMNCGFQLVLQDEVASPVSPPVSVCPGCGYASTAGDAFCENCGLQLAAHSALEGEPAEAEQRQESDTHCSHCGHPRSPDEQYCDNCGLQFSSQDQALVQAIPPQPLSVDETLVEDAPQVDSFAQVCLNCGYPRDPGVNFCDSCGLQYPTPEPSVLPPEPSVDLRPGDDNAYITGKLLVRSTRAEIALPVGKTELLLGRTDPVRNIFPDVDLTTYGGDKGGVSRRHALLSQSGPQLFLEDLNSTNFTFLNQRKLEPGQRYPLSDGDEIRLGLLVMEYRSGW